MTPQLYEAIREYLERRMDDAKRRRDEDEAEFWYQMLDKHAKENGR